jgi:hypothetical protein
MYKSKRGRRDTKIARSERSNLSSLTRKEENMKKKFVILFIFTSIMVFSSMGMAYGAEYMVFDSENLHQESPLLEQIATGMDLQQEPMLFEFLLVLRQALEDSVYLTYEEYERILEHVIASWENGIWGFGTRLAYCS